MADPCQHTTNAPIISSRTRIQNEIYSNLALPVTELREMRAIVRRHGIEMTSRLSAFGSNEQNGRYLEELEQRLTKAAKEAGIDLTGVTAAKRPEERLRLLDRALSTERLTESARSLGAGEKELARLQKGSINERFEQAARLVDRLCPIESGGPASKLVLNGPGRLAWLKKDKIVSAEWAEDVQQKPETERIRAYARLSNIEESWRWRQTQLAALGDTAEASRDARLQALAEECRRLQQETPNDSISESSWRR